MPFDEFGAKGEGGSLADGMAEDLTTALARLNWLFVVSRTSAFALKGVKVDSEEAGRRLGVRYLLEGSIRRAGERVRINSQLVEARSGVHIWADHFDGQLDNLLDLQDEIVSSIVGAIEPSLLRAEAERARAARPEDMRSHHYYLRATGLMAAAFTDPAGGALDEGGTDEHTIVVHDMLATGCLIDVRGALVPCDRLIDEGDAGRLHTVIAGGQSSAVVDIKTGDPALRDADEASIGGALFHAGAMRRLMSGADGSAYLGDVAKGAQQLARIKATGPALPMSRSILWALARQRGLDPTRWQMTGNSLITWGGLTLNTLLAAVFSRSAPDRRFAATPTAVSGDIVAIDHSLEAVEVLARRIEAANDLPLAIASKFIGPSRFLSELSDAMSAEEKRRSVPWALLHRWLDRVEGIDLGGSMPSET